MATFTAVNGGIANAVTGTLSGFTGGTLAQLQDVIGDVFVGGVRDPDTIVGGGGNDTITGGGGSDSLNGGAGNDWFEVGDGDAIDTLAGGTGSDTLDLRDVVAGSVTITDLASGNWTMSYAAGTTRTIASIETVYGTQLGDLITGSSAAESIDGHYGNDTLDGGSGADSVLGNLGADSLTGGAGIDTLAGGFGNDTLSGGTDVDSISGGGNDDTVLVAAGHAADSIDGGTGNDTLDLGQNASRGARVDLAGGTWNFTDLPATTPTITSIEIVIGTGLADTLTGAAAAETLSGGNGNDVIEGGAGVDSIDAGAGDDTIALRDDQQPDDVIGGNGTDTLDLDAVTTRAVALDLGAGTWQWSDAFGGQQSIAGIEVVRGTQLDDALTGSASDDTLRGEAGDDTLRGGAGVDDLVGVAGDDRFVVEDGVTDAISGGDGIDTLDLAAASGGATIDLADGSWRLGVNLMNVNSLSGIEVVVGTGQADTVSGGSGAIAEHFAGGAADDSLSGGDGNDTLEGGANNDTLRGQGGNDSIDGGDGNDRIAFAEGDALDDVDGGAGTDWLDLSAVTSVAADIQLNVSYWALGADAGSANGLEGIIGTQLGDNIVGVGEARIHAEGGNDTVQGGDGVNSIDGGGGDDLILLVDGDTIDDVDGGAGTDTLDLSGITTQGAEIVLSTLTYELDDGTGGVRSVVRVERVLGTAAADRIVGTTGADTLVGGSGNDTLVGNNGNDSVSGGNGDDVFQFGFNAGIDAIDGGAGLDLLDAGSVGDPVGVSVHLRLSTWRVMGGADARAITGVEAVRGTNYADSLVGSAGDDSLSGGEGGDDSLNGGDGNDTLAGGIGDDVYTVNRAGDVVSEVDNATLGGFDVVNSSVSRTLGDFQEKLVLTGTRNLAGTGNADANILVGNTGANLLDGGAGADTLNGGKGDDTYLVDDAGDVVNESADPVDGGIDLVRASVAWTLRASQEQLTLTGSTAIDGTGNSIDNVLNGNSAANALRGVDGADTLVGNGGADTLTGGAGRDVMTGGNGGDRFVFESVLDSGPDAAARDLVTDFNAAGDLLDLSGIDANAGVAGNQSFTVLDSGAHFDGSTFTAARKLFYDTTAHVLYGNTDADADAEFSLELGGVASLAVANLLL